MRNLRGAHAPQGRSAGPARSICAPLDGIWTIRAFDEVYTAPHHGFAGATDYYHRASAMRVADRIRIPALILTAEDDPFVPAAQFGDPAVREQSVRSHVRVERDGGHCGFVGDARTATTATGRRRGGGVSRGRVMHGEAARGEPVDERARELRPLPFLFVLEVDEHVVPASAPARRSRSAQCSRSAGV